MKSLKSMKKPVIITAVSALAISGALFSQSTFAAQVTKPIQAVYNNIKIIYNGTEVPYDAKTEPFLLNGVTYLPLKLAGTALDKKVDWDGTNKRVVIADKGVPIDQSTVTALNNQITTLTQELNTAKAANTTKDATIAQLQKDNQTLKDDASKNSSSPMKDLERDLNDDHRDDYDTNSDIELSGNKNDITVTIEMTKSRWEGLSSSKQRTYLEDIVEDILKEYKDAEVDGTVKNSSNNDKLASFTTNSRGDVTIKKVSSSFDANSIQRDLFNRYSNYAGYGFDFSVRGDSSKADVDVFVDLDDWNKMSNSQKSNLTDGVTNFLKDEESIDRVSGTIRNEDNRNLITNF
ncbi:stalk domain-containing protein [Paenibacillus sp. 23TSA30-6]|uniref:stalk domain-containing protein n=1 Tax=Paenibacillus sp. 23TSA30-6 TaxID=2546104 RepID=UPI00178852ED|nr:stalk domain-containing protein [Paenibacillus sp. 23TSA30-6]MBE0337764.1 copper amine oxidase N-terminal domain-containing protein [Paenibacillus sp. 23TSA30-6]